jgi:hypothetical protein
MPRRRSAKLRNPRPQFDAVAAGARCFECPLAKSGKPVAPPGLQQYPGTGRLAIVQDSPSSYEAEKGMVLDTAANRLLKGTLEYANAGHVYSTYACLCDTRGASDQELQQAVISCKPRMQAELDAFEAGGTSNSGKPQWRLILGGLAWQSLAADAFRGDRHSWYGSPLVLRDSSGDKPTSAIASRYPGELVTKGGRRHVGQWTKHVQRAVMLADGRLDKFEWPKESVDVGECVPALKRIVRAIRRGAQYGFDLESDGLEYLSNISCMAVALPKESVCVQFPPTADEKVLLVELLRLPGMVGHNIAYFDRPLLQYQGWQLHDTFFDTMFAASILDPQQDKDLHSVVAGEFAAEAWKAGFKTDVDTGVLQGGIWGSTDPAVARERRVYCVRDAYTSLLAGQVQKTRLQTYGQTFLDDLMFQYPTSMQMRRTGLLWNREAAARLDAEWSAKKEVALAEARRLAAEAGPEFANLNPGSPTQLRKLFFDRCGLAPTHWTDKGLTSTGYDALMAIKKQADNSFAAKVAQQVLDYRDADKMLGSYIRGLAPPSGQDRVYGAWKVHATVSGRWGCSKL